MRSRYAADKTKCTHPSLRQAAVGSGGQVVMMVTR